LGYEVVGVSRTQHVNSNVICDISGDTDWADILEHVDIIIHCAATVHQMDLSKNDVNIYQHLNVDGTLNLAEQAKESVKRFVFLSTIKVNGEQTFDRKFFADDIPNPTDAYSISKDRAEIGLRNIAQTSQMEVVIIRSPLIYGPNLKGNLKKLTKCLKYKIPLPFGSVNLNLRSFVYIGNLIDFIYICSKHEAAKNETFLVSDDTDLNTADMINLISNSLGIRVKLLPVPVFVLRLLFNIFGKQELEVRLLGNLCIDVTKNKELLDWTPKYSVQEGFRQSFK
jgi:nucleoside-diphosphate-sugar epimerase